MSCLLYGIAMIYIISVLFGSTFNKRALRRSWLVVLIAALPLLWLYLQTLLPFGNSLSQSMSLSLEPGAWLLPQALMSITPDKTLWLLYSYLPAFVCMLLACSMITSRARVKQFLYLTILLLLLHAVAAIYAKYHGIYLIDKTLLDGHWSAARGWFVNRNHFAAFILSSLVGVLAFVHYRVQEQSKLLTKFACGILMILSLVAIVLSQSRAGLVCWILILLVIGMTSFQSLRRARDRNGAAIGLVGLSLVSLIIITVGVIVFGSELGGRLQQTSLGIGERGLQWQITWSAIKQSPWIGYGGGSYAYVFQYFREYAELRQVVFDQSHNHYLQVWLEQGLIGLLFWLGLIVAVGAYAGTTIRNSRSRLLVSTTVAACAVLVAALVQSLVDFNLQIINLRCFFFVIIGLVLALPTARYKQGT